MGSLGDLVYPELIIEQTRGPIGPPAAAARSAPVNRLRSYLPALLLVEGYCTDGMGLVYIVHVSYDLPW